MTPEEIDAIDTDRDHDAPAAPIALHMPKTERLAGLLYWVIIIMLLPFGLALIAGLLGGFAQLAAP